jgi:hypothetical protein
LAAKKRQAGYPQCAQSHHPLLKSADAANPGGHAGLGAKSRFDHPIHKKADAFGKDAKPP